MKRLLIILFSLLLVQVDNILCGALSVTTSVSNSALRPGHDNAQLQKSVSKAVIVGAGPSGLSAALMLQQCHDCQVQYNYVTLDII